MPKLADSLDARLSKLETDDKLGKTGVGRFNDLISDISEATGIASDQIYIVGMARPNNFNIRLTQGKAQHQHHQLSLGVIYKGVRDGTVDSGLKAAMPFVGGGNAQHDAIGVVVKEGGKWKIAGLVEAPGTTVSQKLLPDFPSMIVRKAVGTVTGPLIATPPTQPPEPPLGASAQDPADIAAAFAEALEAAHVSFGPGHDELVSRFVASLMAKPFLILTGVSGSGKTQLALQLGNWFGDDKSLLVPVRPDWTGPEYLLGFENALGRTNADGRRSWVVPAVLEFILKAARDESGRPYLLILDEMNLAHVERYFADVLSGMESSTPILPNLTREDGAWYPTPGQPALRLPRNLFIVGTVNVDETTYLFSPKVLDRANTIEFRVSTASLATDAASVRKPGRAAEAVEELLKSFVAVAADDDWHRDNAPEDVDQFMAHVRNLHAGLSASGYEFGHRTFYEGVRLGSMLAEAGLYELDQRLDIFVLQKVLPRLYGTRRKLDRVLRTVGAFAADLREPADAREFELDSAIPSPRLPRTFAKIMRMHEALKANQFASFTD